MYIYIYTYMHTYMYIYICILCYIHLLVCTVGEVMHDVSHEVEVGGGFGVLHRRQSPQLRALL